MGGQNTATSDLQYTKLRKDGWRLAMERCIKMSAGSSGKGITKIMVPCF